MEKTLAQELREEGDRLAFKMESNAIRGKTLTLEQCQNLNAPSQAEVDEELTPEVGDKVEFTAQGKYGEIAGDGVITEVFKNKSIKVEFGGQIYKAEKYEILAKAC